MTQRTSPRRPAQPDHRPAKGSQRRKSIVDQRRVPWGLVVTAVAVLVFAAAVAVVVAVRGHKSTHTAAGEVMPAAVAGPVTNERAPQPVGDRSGIPGVLAWNTQGWPGDGSTPAGSVQHDHVPGAVRYTELPPVGGPHNATWLNPGVYDRPVPSERAVHNMEHGAVWITYRPSLPKAQVRALRSFMLRQSKLPEQTQSGTSSSRYIVMSPWSSAALPAPIVISSWGHQLRLPSPADPRLQRFVDVFRSSATYTPEHGEPVDGVPTSVGGRPSAQ